MRSNLQTYDEYKTSYLCYHLILIIPQHFSPCCPALVRCAEDLIHTLADTLLPGDAQTKEEWVQDPDRLKENIHSAVELPHQTLGAVADFDHYYNKVGLLLD